MIYVRLQSGGRRYYIMELAGASRPDFGHNLIIDPHFVPSNKSRAEYTRP